MKKILAAILFLASLVPNLALAQTQATMGGTGLTTYAAGDLIYAATLNPIRMTKLNIGGSGTCLTSNGSIPVWGGCGSGGAGSGTVATSTPLVSGQVDFSTGVNTIGNDSTFLFDTSTKILTVTSFLANSSSTLQNFTFINATGTSATTTNFKTTNLYVSGLGTGRIPYISSNGLFVTSAGLQFDDTTNKLTVTELIATRATTTSATSTSLFATTASTTSFFGAGLPGAGCQTTNALTYDGAGKFTCTAQPQGTVTSVSGTLNRISSTGGATPILDIDTAYVGQTSITTLGTITTGVWNAGAVTSSGLGTFANLLVTGSSTLQNFTFVNATGTSATTTNLFATNASTTNFFGAGLTACSGSNALQWAVTGRFSCAAVAGGSASSTLLSDNNAFTGLNTFTDLKLVTRSTTTEATTTSLFATTASTTNLFLATGGCSGANALNVSAAGKVTCGAVSGSGSASTTLLADNNTFTGLNQFDKLTATNSTTTNATTTTASFTNASTTNFTLSGVKSALLITNSSGTVSGYGGAAACAADNFVTTISVLGATTCGSSTISGVALGGTLAALTAGTGLTSAGTYTGATGRTFSIDQTFSPTWTGTHIFDLISRSTTTQATTTNFHLSSNGLTVGASGQYVNATTSGSLNIASTTLGIAAGISFSTGTTTLTLHFPEARKLSSFGCQVFAGTSLRVEIGTGSATSSAVCTTTYARTYFAANNTFTADQLIYVAVGTKSGSPDRVEIDPAWFKTAP